MATLVKTPRYRGSTRSARDVWRTLPSTVVELGNTGRASTHIWVREEPELQPAETTAQVGDVVLETPYDESVFERLLELAGKTPNVPFDGDDDL